MLTTLITGKDVEKNKLYSLLAGMQNDSAILENSSAVSYKTKHIREFPGGPVVRSGN